jgi:pimeloyl-ACP methyl ester carboxylesterase
VSVAALLLLGGTVEVAIHHYDPTRIIYKRLKADDRYVYEEVHPRFLETDPRALISSETRHDPASVRARLVDLAWGADGYPADQLPQTIEVGVSDHPLPRLAKGVRVDRVRVGMEHNLWSIQYYLHAPQPINRLVLYHHGFGDGMETVTPLLNALLAAGYDVLAIDALGFGSNARSGSIIDSSGASAHIFFNLTRIDRPLRFHLEPIVVGLNHALRSRIYLSADMIGFSMGGFLTALAVAIETRISGPQPVADIQSFRSLLLQRLARQALRGCGPRGSRRDTGRRFIRRPARRNPCRSPGLSLHHRSGARRFGARPLNPRRRAAVSPRSSPGIAIGWRPPYVLSPLSMT